MNKQIKRFLVAGIITMVVSIFCFCCVCYFRITSNPKIAIVIFLVFSVGLLIVAISNFIEAGKLIGLKDIAKQALNGKMGSSANTRNYYVRLCVKVKGDKIDSVSLDDKQ